MSDTQVQISPLDSETITVPIRGTMPLICANFSDAARQKMLDEQQGRKSPKTNRDPQHDYEESFYYTKSGHGFPAAGFLQATIGGARFYGKSVTMTGLRQSLFMPGVLTDADSQPLFEIEGEPRMREDYVRHPSTDLAFRAEFPEWTTVLTVVFVRSLLTRSSVLSLIDAGGMGVGVGAWRPERRGMFGTYEIDQSRDVEVLP